MLLLLGCQPMPLLSVLCLHGSVWDLQPDKHGGRPSCLRPPDRAMAQERPCQCDAGFQSSAPYLKQHALGSKHWRHQWLCGAACCTTGTPRLPLWPPAHSRPRQSRGRPVTPPACTSMHSRLRGCNVAPRRPAGGCPGSRAQAVVARDARQPPGMGKELDQQLGSLPPEGHGVAWPRPAVLQPRRQPGALRMAQLCHGSAGGQAGRPAGRQAGATELGRLVCGCGRPHSQVARPP